MNIHDFKERPIMSQGLWDSFGFKVLMGGMGDDTAMLIAELYERGFEPDEIVFCDTGSEFPHTYEFIKFLQNWCDKNKWSKVVILKKLDKFDQPLSVISLCQSQNTLPAVAFGSKSCSLRFKAETADKYFNNKIECWVAWGSKKSVFNDKTKEMEEFYAKGTRINTHTGKILRIVGLNEDEPNRVAKWRNEPKWCQSFPLFDWGIGEHESDAVERVGLYYPGKSSCTVCPNMSHGEIAMLRDNYPEIHKQSLSIESVFIDNQRIDEDIIIISETLTNSDTNNMTKEQYVAIDFIYEKMTCNYFIENKKLFYPHDEIIINQVEDDAQVDFIVEYRDYTTKDLLNSLVKDGYVSITLKSTTRGLGRSKTWPEKLAEYDANPSKYKRMTDNKPCECGH